jgi:hypothetical protein
MLAPDGLMVYRDQLCQAFWYEEINGAALAADHSQYSSTVSSLGAPCALLIAANHVSEPACAVALSRGASTVRGPRRAQAFRQCARTPPGRRA